MAFRSSPTITPEQLEVDKATDPMTLWKRRYPLAKDQPPASWLLAADRRLPQGNAFYLNRRRHAQNVLGDDIDGDVTSFHPPDWNLTMPHILPDIMYQYKPTDADQAVSTWGMPPIMVDGNGVPITDPENPNHPMFDFETLPDQIGRNEDPWIYELFCRRDLRIGPKDLIARMRSGDGGRRPTTEDIIKGMQNARMYLNMSSWSKNGDEAIMKHEAEEVKKGRRKAMTEMMIKNNSTRGITPGFIDPLNMNNRMEPNFIGMPKRFKSRIHRPFTVQKGSRTRKENTRNKDTQLERVFEYPQGTKNTEPKDSGEDVLAGGSHAGSVVQTVQQGMAKSISPRNLDDIRAHRRRLGATADNQNVDIPRPAHLALPESPELQHVVAWEEHLRSAVASNYHARAVTILEHLLNEAEITYDLLEETELWDCIDTLALLTNQEVAQLAQAVALRWRKEFANHKNAAKYLSGQDATTSALVSSIGSPLLGPPHKKPKLSAYQTQPNIIISQETDEAAGSHPSSAISLPGPDAGKGMDLTANNPTLAQESGSPSAREASGDNV